MPMKSIFILCLCLLWCLTCHAKPATFAEQYHIESKVLAATRAYYVHLPDDYQQSKRKYPVLYVLHGQWDTLPAVATLALLGDEIPGVILVGIESRGPELHIGDELQPPFARFLNQELLPTIAANYRVAKLQILMGHSSAGRFVMNQWLQDEHSFAAYYAFSPSMEDGELVNRLGKLSDAEIKTRAPLTLTLANEGEHMQQPFETIKARLEAIPEAGFISTHFLHQSHSASRHDGLMFALRHTFALWQPDYQTKIGPFPALLKHYHDIGARLGFDADISPQLLHRLSAYFAMENTPQGHQSLLQVVEYGLRQAQNNAAAFWEVVDYLSKNGSETAAQGMIKALCNIQPSQDRCQPTQD